MPRKTVETTKLTDAKSILAFLQPKRDARFRARMSERFGITGTTANTAYGISVSELRKLAKTLRGRGRTEADALRNHALAQQLWETGQYDARLLAAFVDEPKLITSGQMDRWARAFDNWAVCDTACFCLFDRAATKIAFEKVFTWARRKEEFVRRAAFALLASLALHDKQTGDAEFERCLPLTEEAAADDRNFVKKAVSWALRGMAKRNRALKAKVTALSQRLAVSENAASRWIGKDVLRELKKR